MTLMMRAGATPGRPARVRRSGTVISVRELAADIVELTVEVDDRIPWLPGQAVLLSTGSGPGRAYCPTFGLHAEAEEHTLTFHVRRRQGGAFSGAPWRPGARVGVSGPFGDAFLRHGDGDLVLVGIGTGFAAAWAMAVAARLGQPHRPLTVIAAASSPRDLYMRPALAWLRARGVETLAVARHATAADLFVRAGEAADRLPELSPGCELHACGSPSAVDAVCRAAARQGVLALADPFRAAAAERADAWAGASPADASRAVLAG